MGPQAKLGLYNYYHRHYFAHMFCYKLRLKFCFFLIWFFTINIFKPLLLYLFICYFVVTALSIIYLFHPYLSIYMFRYSNLFVNATMTIIAH